MVIDLLTRAELRRVVGPHVRIRLDPGTLGWEITTGSRRLVLTEVVEDGQLRQYVWTRYARKPMTPHAVEDDWDAVDSGTAPANKRESILHIARDFAASH
jgi:hypothetical protein